MKKQTAVEWLKKILDGQKDKQFDYDEWCIAFDHAKEMEKEQINDACYEGYYQEGMYDTRAYYDNKYKK